MSLINGIGYYYYIIQDIAINMVLIAIFLLVHYNIDMNTYTS